MAIPKIEANFSTSLAAKISSSASSLTLNTSTDDDGATLNATYFLTLSEGASNEEHMLVVLNGATGTITTRGLSRVDATTNQSANQFEHDRGASVKITNLSLLKVVERLNGDEAFDSPDWTGVQSIDGLALPTAGELTKAASVDYANNLAIAGAPDMAAVTKGLGEKALDSELASGAADGSGDTTAPLVATSTSFNSTSTANKVPVADASGVLDDGYIALTTRGDLVTRDATGLARLGVGTANQYLTTDGTDVSWGGANLDEANTFFGSTDISASEAETLTDGSDADSLHTHPALSRGFNLTLTVTDSQKNADQASFAGYSDDSSAYRITVTSETTTNPGGAMGGRIDIASDFGTGLFVADADNFGTTGVNTEGSIYIGTNWWLSYGTNAMAKDGAGVTFASQATEGALGHDPTNSYMLILSSTTNIRRFSGIAGTTLTFVDNITLDTAVTQCGFFYDDTNSRYICIDKTANVIRRFDSSGTTIDTTVFTVSDNNVQGCCAIDGRVYLINQRQASSNSNATPTNNTIAVDFIPTTLTL